MAKIVIDARSRGSTGRYADRLIKYLQKIDRDNDYTVIVKPKQTWTPKASNFTRLDCDVKDYTFAEQFKLWRILKKLNPDLVHFTMPQQPLLYRGRTVTTFHDLTMLRHHNINGNRLIYWLKLMVFRYMLFVVSRRSSAIITPTKFVKLDLVKTLKTDPIKTHITYESVDVIGTKPDPVSQLDGKQFLLFSGNVFPHKNVERLIEAFAVLKLKHPKLHLAIAGKLNDEAIKLKDSTAASGPSKVHFLGFVSDNELRWLLQNAVAYVYPSLSEGFGLPGLEAMRYETPLVSSNATCLPEVYADAARYFDPTDTIEMAKAIDEVLTDKQLSHQLIKAGLKRLKSFSWQKMATETLAVYNSVLK